MGKFFASIQRSLKDFFYEFFRILGQPLRRKKNKGLATQEELLKKKRNQRVKELLFIWSVLIIPIIELLIFWVYGTFQSYLMAFEQYSLEGVKSYGIQNFEFLINKFSEPGSIFTESLINNLKYWAFNFFIVTPIGIVMGYFIYKKIWFYGFFRYVFFFPSIISSVILSVFFKQMVAPGGPLQIIITKLINNGEEIFLLNDSRYAFKTLLFYNFYFGLCGNLLLWLASFSRIPDEIIEAGRLDGLNIFSELLHITIPIAGPFVATMLLLKVVAIFSSSGPALLLTGGSYGTYDLGYYSYVLTISGTKQDQALSSAIGITTGLATLPIAFTVNHFVNKIDTVEV